VPRTELPPEVGSQTSITLPFPNQPQLIKFDTPPPSLIQKTFWLETRSFPTADSGALSQTLSKVFRATDTDHLKKAAQKAIETWLPMNAVSVSTTMIVCMVPGGTGTCVINGAAQAFDLGTSITIELIKLLESEGKITALERQNLTTLLSAASFGVSNLRVIKAFTDVLIQGLKAVEFTVENEKAKFAIHVVTDFIDKYYVVIDLIKQ
jgi:hypothetical protein